MKDYSYELLDLLESIKEMRRAAAAGRNKPVGCLYAFSPLRENLFEWLEMKKNRPGSSRSDPTTVPVPGSFRSAPVRWSFWISGMRIWR